MNQQRTSISAYREITDSGRKQSHKERILAAMKEKGGGTYEEIARKADLSYQQTWKRMSDLVKDGHVVDTGQVRNLSSGNKGIVWEVQGSSCGTDGCAAPETTKTVPVFGNVIKKVMKSLSNSYFSRSDWRNIVDNSATFDIRKQLYKSHDTVGCENGISTHSTQLSMF